LPESWQEAVSRIERATARLHAIPPDDGAALIEVMSERSRAIARLGELIKQSSEPIPEPLLERLEAQLAATPAIANKFRLLRAAAQIELARITEAVFLARSLGRGPRERRLVDLIG
jgi:hypothetical protein